MSAMDIIEVMCEGNPEALNVLFQMMEDSRGFMDIFFCDSLGIRGVKLYKLKHDCCGGNYDKFSRL